MSKHQIIRERERERERFAVRRKESQQESSAYTLIFSLSNTSVDFHDELI